ncbi:hypothetical protein JXO59_05720 [candidate division KSB1 bacterium]|nr:hypothetical protein [candidate division KSB1 bacterium]
MSNKILKCMLLVTLIMGLIPSCFAQINISALLVNRELRVFFLSDFNFTGRGTSSGEIFQVRISNATLEPVSFQLRLLIRYNSQDLDQGITRPYTLSFAESPILITKQNLFSQAQKFSLQDYAILPEGKDIRDKILTTGRLPSGIYQFIFQIIDPSMPGPPVDEAFLEIDISNPSTLDLISPGSPADHASADVIITTQPVFRWTSNMGKFRLRLAEKLPDVHDSASPAEIIQDRVRFEGDYTVDATKSGGTAPDGSTYLPATILQYPPAGAWPLERGKVYYWQVTGLVPTSGAELELPSEIWAFQISPLENLTPALTQTLLLERLRAILGDRFENLFSAGGGLAGFSPTGMCMLNGKWLSAEEVQRILAKIASGEYELIDLRVE